MPQILSQPSLYSGVETLEKWLIDNCDADFVEVIFFEGLLAALVLFYSTVFEVLFFEFFEFCVWVFLSILKLNN